VPIKPNMEHQINANESEPETTQFYDNVTANNTSIETKTLNE